MTHAWPTPDGSRLAHVCRLALLAHGQGRLDVLAASKQEFEACCTRAEASLVSLNGYCLLQLVRGCKLHATPVVRRGSRSRARAPPVRAGEARRRAQEADRAAGTPTAAGAAVSRLSTRDLPCCWACCACCACWAGAVSRDFRPFISGLGFRAQGSGSCSGPTLAKWCCCSYFCCRPRFTLTEAV